MNPEDLAQMQATFRQISKDLASGDLAKVKAAQTQLQALGYDIKPDGKLGGKTSAAIGALRKSIEDAQGNIATTATAEAEKAANDPVNRLTKLGTEVGPYAAGGLLGYGISRKLSAGNKLADQRLNTQVGNIANNPEIRPDVARQELGRLKRGRLSSNIKQAGVPGAFFAGAEATRRFVAPQFEDPGTREAVNLIATGEQGAGITLAAKQLMDLGMRGNPIDAEQEALIRSRDANISKPLPQSIPPQASPPQSRPAIAPPAQSVPTNAQTLINAARAAGAEGKLTKASAAKYLQKNINDQNRASVAKALRVNPGPNFTERLTKKVKGLSSSRKTLPGIAMPFVAGMIGYDMATSDAEARGLTGTEKTARGLATGTAAAGLYEGGRRIMNKLPPIASGPLGALPAMTVDPLEGGSREETVQNISDARGRTSESAPWLSENVLGIPRSEGQMYSKAQVPPRNPTRGLPAGADPDVAKAWRSSPRRTIIELSRNSGLDANDIATLAGVAPDEVASVMGAIPQRAMEMRASP